MSCRLKSDRKTENSQLNQIILRGLCWYFGVSVTYQLLDFMVSNDCLFVSCFCDFRHFENCTWQCKVVRYEPQKLCWNGQLYFIHAFQLVLWVKDWYHHFLKSFSILVHWTSPTVGVKWSQKIIEQKLSLLNVFDSWPRHGQSTRIKQHWKRKAEFFRRLGFKSNYSSNWSTSWWIHVPEVTNSENKINNE